MTRRFLLSVLALLVLTACGDYSLPPLPLAVHIASDIPAEDAASWRAGIAEWNAATGIEIAYEGDGSGCGLYVTRGDDLIKTDSVGRTSWKDDCQLRARMKPGRSVAERARTGAHEIGHAIMGMDDDHSEDEHSVMYPYFSHGTFITDEDVEKAMRRVPASMKVSAP